MSLKQYKSTAERLARFFEQSRDRWKERAAQKQRTIRTQRVTIRDLKASRDHWKAEAQAATQQLAQLQAQAHAQAAAAASATASPFAPPAVPEGASCLGGP